MITQHDSAKLILKTLFIHLEWMTELDESVGTQESADGLLAAQAAVDLAIERLEDLVPLPDELTSSGAPS